MTDSFFNKDWRKLAAVTATSDADIEKAFADQASGFVENKLGELMKNPYNIGFEIVRKNENNTRMVGIFAFKVEKSLLFAPVFFLNGEIKGPLLYRCDTKTFVPANKEWAAYLISALERKEGTPEGRENRHKYAPLVQMDRVNMLPKSANIVKLAKTRKVINVPFCTCEKNPVPTPDGTCTVVIHGQKKLTPSNWNNRLPGGQNILRMSAQDDGTIKCSAMGLNAFELLAKDGQLFEDVDSVVHSVAIEGNEGEFYEIHPEGVKLARATFFSGEKENGEQWDHLLDNMAWPVKPEGLIRDFLNEPDYGEAATNAITKAASDSYDFAEQLMTIYGAPENFMPSRFVYTDHSAPEEGKLHLVTDADGLKQASDAHMLNKKISDEVQRAMVAKGPNATEDDAVKEHIRVSKKYGITVKDKRRIKHASIIEPSQFFRDGFYIYDERPQEDLTVVNEDAGSEITSPSNPGVYALITNDGKFTEDVLVLKVSANRQIGDAYKIGVSRNTVRAFHNKQQERESGWLCIKGGKIAFYNDLMGIRTGDLTTFNGYSDKVAAGNVYMIVMNDIAIGPVAVHDVKNVDGVQHVTYTEGTIDPVFDSQNIYLFDKKEGLIINPELDKSNIGECVIGNDAKFIRVDVSPDLRGRDTHRTVASVFKDGGCLLIDHLTGIGAGNSISDYLKDQWHLPQIKVHTVEKDASYKIVMPYDESPVMSKKDTILKLAQDLAFPADAAYALVEAANDLGSHSCVVKMPEKVASRLRLSEFPVFEEDQDDATGMKVDTPQEFRLHVSGTQTSATPSSFGDAMNPNSLTGLPDSAVVSAVPEELRALADTYKLPNVFEHGVIGTLANAFSALPLINKYIPKLEDAVDVLGRIKFCFYWSPQDFEKAYGADDMMNLEAEIDANFDALGALLLNLLKKTDQHRRGVQHTSDKDTDSES